MKTERRHQLEANELARNLTDWGDKLRPYASALLAGIALLLVAYIGASLWNKHQAGREQQAWDKYELAVFGNDAEMKDLELAASSDEWDGTGMQEWAYVGWADRQLLQASHMYLSNREAAQERLTKVAQVYEQLAENAVNREVKNRARLGLGRLYEMQNKVEPARQQYGLVDGELGEIAQVRLKALENKKTQDEVAWLLAADLPKPAGGAAAGSRPGFEAPLPATDAPAGQQPGEPSLEDLLGGLEEEDDKAPRYPADDKPAEPAEQPAAEAPADDKSTEAEPAAEGTPASTDAPAAEADPAAESSAAPAEDAESADEQKAAGGAAPAESSPAESTPPAGQ